MPAYEYCSIFAGEICSFLKYRENILTKQKLRNESYVLKTLDDIIAEEKIASLEISMEIFNHWLSCQECSQNTKVNKVSTYRCFSKYLHAKGITAYWPDNLRRDQSYIPYVLSENELELIFQTADNLCLKSKLSDANIWFPMLLRLLYGCGMRIGEALHLRVKDFNFDSGEIWIHKAKGNKERIVVMHPSLLRICHLYQQRFLPEANDEEYFFHNRQGKPFPNVTAYVNLVKVLKQAGIEQHPNTEMSRGIGLHTFRHTFAVKSLQSQTIKGIDRFYAIPILSTYMGHNNIYGTEIYLHLTPEYHESIISRASNYTGDIFPEVLL